MVFELDCQVTAEDCQVNFEVLVPILQQSGLPTISLRLGGKSGAAGTLVCGRSAVFRRLSLRT
jgi:hypothetical protein